MQRILEDFLSSKLDESSIKETRRCEEELRRLKENRED